MEIKRCITCGRFLGKNSFSYSNERKGWLRSECKRCTSNRNYLRILDNKEYFKQYYIDNKESIKQYKKQYRKDNQEKIKQRREDNHKYHKEYKKQWYQDNKESCREYNKQWRINNSEYDKRYKKQYREDNRDKVNASNAKRRVVKRNQTTTLTQLEKDRYNFTYEVASTMVDYVVDHIQPISKGGSDHPGNLQILTRELNSEKRSKWPLTEEEEIKYNGFKL